MRTTPASGRSRPDRMPRMVDLPHPDGPRMATNAPRSAVRRRSASTGSVPPAPAGYDFETPSRTAAASGIGDQRGVFGGGLGRLHITSRAIAPAIDAALDAADDRVLDEQHESQEAD